MSYAYILAGNIPSAKEELSKWLELKSFKGHYQTAMIYTGLKEYDLAISELDMAYHDRDITMYFIKVDLVFSPLRSEPWFHDLLKKMNLE